jgi:hypothetical protein
MRQAALVNSKAARGGSSDCAGRTTGPITGILAARAGYASVFLVGAVATLVGIGFVFAERANSKALMSAVISGKQETIPVDHRQPGGNDGEF